MATEGKYYVIETPTGIVIKVVTTLDKVNLSGARPEGERSNLIYREITKMEADYYTEVVKQRNQETAPMRFGTRQLELAMSQIYIG